MSARNHFPAASLLPNGDALDGATLHHLVQPFRVGEDADGAPHDASEAGNEDAQAEAPSQLTSPGERSDRDETRGPLAHATLHDPVQPFSDCRANHEDAVGSPAHASGGSQTSDTGSPGSHDHYLHRQAGFVDEVEAILRRAPGHHEHAAPQDQNGSARSARPSPHSLAEQSQSPPPAFPPESATSVDMANALITALTRRWENPPEVSEQQKTAIEMLLNGRKQDEIAGMLGVHRSTLWRWRNQDPDFRRALTIAREKAFRRSTEQLREFVPKALDVVLTQLQQGNYQAAVQVLRLVRIDRHEPTPAYPTRKLRRDLRK